MKSFLVRVGNKTRQFVGYSVMSLGVAPLAMAQTTFDTTTIVAAITAAGAAVLLLGAAVVAGPKIAVKAWKWISSSL